MGLGVGPML